jgi:hypothetical protein
VPEGFKKMERVGRGVSEGLRKRWGESVCRGVGRGVLEGVHYAETMGRGGARRYGKVER